MYSIFKGLALVLLGAGLSYGSLSYFDIRPSDTHSPEVAQPQNAEVATTAQVAKNSPARTPSTLRQILEITSDFEQTAELYQLIRYMGAGALNTLLDEAATLNQISQRVAAVSIIYAKYAEADPEAAIKRATSQSDQSENTWVASIFHNWSRLDLDAAVNFAATLGKSAMQVAGAAILNARDDLSSIERQLIAETLNVGPVLARIDLRNRSVAFAANPEGAWADALNISDPQQKNQVLQSLGMLWAQKDPKAALTAMASLKDQRLNNINYAIAQRWAQKDADAALEWIVNMPSGIQRTLLLSTTIGVLVTKDAQQAVRWAELQSDADRHQAMQIIAQSWIVQDIEAATAWLDELNEPGIYQNVLPSLANQYANSSFDKAYEWLDTLNEQQTTTAVQHLIANEARHDPQQAARRIEKFKDTSLWQTAASNLVQSWAQQDPEAAMKWLNAQKTQDRSGIYQSLTMLWASLDSQAAIRSLDSIRDRASHDAASIGVMQTLKNSPEQAEQIYNDLQGDSQKSYAAGIMYSLWIQRDPAKAEKYLKQAQIAGITGSGC